MKIYTATNVKTGETFEGTVKDLINELGFKRCTIYGYANTGFIFNNTWKFSSTEKDTKYENTGFVDNSLWGSWDIETKKFKDAYERAHKKEARRKHKIRTPYNVYK